MLNTYLKKNLDNQTTNHELIFIDNTTNKYKSASEALNYGGNKAKGKYLIFVHQDVDLLTKTILDDLELILDNTSNLGVAGVAGKSKNSRYIVSNIKEGIPPKDVSDIHIKKPVKVQTVDECFFVIPKSVFNTVKFDEKVCDGWHLYGVDYCLDVKEMGLDVYVVPIKLYHRSAANSFSIDYYFTVKKLIKKHEKSFNSITTTMGNWNNSKPFHLQVIYQIIVLYYTKFKQQIWRN
jgi:hypothetical protein